MEVGLRHIRYSVKQNVEAHAYCFMVIVGAGSVTSMKLLLKGELSEYSDRPPVSSTFYIQGHCIFSELYFYFYIRVPSLPTSTDVELVGIGVADF